MRISEKFEIIADTYSCDKVAKNISEPIDETKYGLDEIKVVNLY